MSTSFRKHDRSHHNLIHVDPVPVHISAYVTGGLESLYKRINGQESQNTWGYGHFTDSNGHFDPKEDCRMALRYQVIGQLGHGQSSVFVKAKDLFCHNQLVAIKVLHRHYYNLGAQETHCMQMLNNADPHHHAHVVRLHNTFVFDDHFCMVFELLEPKPLTQTFCRLEKCQILTPIRKVAWKLLQVVGFLQKENVIHADLKPENILLRNDNDVGSLRVADFGNAIHCVHNEVSLYYQDFELQTLLYRAPEVLFGLPFSVEIDMWSLGCILAELYLGRPLFFGTDKLKLLAKMYRVLGPMPSDVFYRAKFYSKLQAYCAAGSQRDATRFLMISYGMERSFASFLAGLLRFNPNERLTPFQAAQHPFLATESGFCFLLPKSIVGNEAYPRIQLSNSEYQERPLVDDNVRRQHMSSLDLLTYGTSYASHEVFAVSKRNCESGNLYRKPQLKVAATQDKPNKQHNHWYRLEADDKRDIAPRIVKPKPIFGLEPKEIGLDSKVHEESLELESKLCPSNKKEEHINIPNISVLHRNQQQETQQSASGSNENVQPLSPKAKDGNVYYTENKIYIISGRQNILELHESQENWESKSGQERSTHVCSKSNKKNNQINEGHRERRNLNPITPKEDTHQKSDSAEVISCPTGVQFKEDSGRHHVMNVLPRDSTTLLSPSVENNLPVVKNKYLDIKDENINSDSLNRKSNRNIDLSTYCKSRSPDKDSVVENIACKSNLISEKKIPISAVDSLDVNFKSKLSPSSDFSRFRELSGLSLDNNDTPAYPSRQEHLDLQKISKMKDNIAGENYSEIAKHETAGAQVSSHHTDLNLNSAYISEDFENETLLKQEKDGYSSAGEGMQCGNKKRQSTVNDEHPKQHEPNVTEEVIGDISDFSDADEFRYEQTDNHSLKGEQHPRCATNAMSVKSRGSAKDIKQKKSGNVHGTQTRDQMYSSSSDEHVESYKARIPRLCKENNHKRCKTSPFRIDAWNHADDSREKKKTSVARKYRHINECVTPDETVSTKHKQVNKDHKRQVKHDGKMGTSHKNTPKQKDMQNHIDSAEERSAVKNGNEEVKTPNNKSGRKLVMPDTGKAKPKKKGPDSPDIMTVKENKHENRVKVTKDQFEDADADDTVVIKSQKKKKKKHHKKRSLSCEKTPDYLSKRRTPSKSQMFERKEPFDNRALKEKRKSLNLEDFDSRVHDEVGLLEMTEKGRRDRHWEDLHTASEFAKYENSDPYLSDVAEDRPHLNKDSDFHRDIKKRKSPRLQKEKISGKLNKSDVQASAKLTRIDSSYSKMSNAKHIERSTNNQVKICKEFSDRRKSETDDFSNAKYDKNRCKRVECRPDVSVFNFVGTPVKTPSKSPLKPVKGKNGHSRKSADKSHDGQCVNDRNVSPDMMLKTETSCKNKMAVNDTKSKSKLTQWRETRVTPTRHCKSVNQKQNISSETFLSENEQNCPKQERARDRPKGCSSSNYSAKRSDVLNLGEKSSHLLNDNITETSATVTPNKQDKFKEPVKTSLSINKVPSKLDVLSSDEFSLYSDDFENTHSQQSDDGCTAFDSTLLYAPGGSCSIVTCNESYESSKKRKHSESILNSGFREHAEPVMEKRRKTVNQSHQSHNPLQMGAGLKLLKHWRSDSEFDDEVLLLPE